MLYLIVQASSTKEHRLGRLQRPEMYFCKLVLESGYLRTGSQHGPVVVTDGQTWDAVGLGTSLGSLL